MKNYIRDLTVILAVVLARPSFGAPVLTVSDLGVSGPNRLWLVEVAPDSSLFVNGNEGLGGSLAVELAFEVTGSRVVGVTKNGTDWPADNLGNNPFTASVSTGVVVNDADFDIDGDVDGADYLGWQRGFGTTSGALKSQGNADSDEDVDADDLTIWESQFGSPLSATVFAALGSEIFTTDDPVEVLSIETAGTGPTTLTWGGHTLRPDTSSEFTGSRIAQGGTNFDGYEGLVSSVPNPAIGVPEPATSVLLALAVLGVLSLRKPC